MNKYQITNWYSMGLLVHWTNLTIFNKVLVSSIIFCFKKHEHRYCIGRIMIKWNMCYTLVIFEQLNFVTMTNENVLLNFYYPKQISNLFHFILLPRSNWCRIFRRGIRFIHFYCLRKYYLNSKLIHVFNMCIKKSIESQFSDYYNIRNFCIYYMV